VTAFFTYERDFALRWIPVVYHDAPPRVRQGTVWPVPADCLDEDGSPRFGALQARFAPPPAIDEDGEAGT
jgi:hypothetical protein